MSSEESREARNMRVVREVWEGFYMQGDVSVFFANVADDFVWRSDTLLPAPGKIVGKRAAAEATMEIFRLLPGIKGEIIGAAAGGDTVTLVTRARAFRSDGFMGLPKIDRPIGFHQCVFFIVNQEGKIQEQLFFFDRGFILGQLGVLPAVSVFGGPEARLWPHFVYPEHLFQQGDGRGAQGADRRESAGLARMMVEILLFPMRSFVKGLRTALSSNSH